jgi:hypothetical protein
MRGQHGSVVQKFAIAHMKKDQTHLQRLFEQTKKICPNYPAVGLLKPAVEAQEEPVGALSKPCI